MHMCVDIVFLGVFMFTTAAKTESVPDLVPASIFSDVKTIEQASTD